MRKLKRMEQRIMTVLEDLQGGQADLDAAVLDLVVEDATMLADFGAKIDALMAELAAGNGIDPAAVTAVTADMHARAAALRDLIATNTAADPGATGTPTPPVDGSPGGPVEPAPTGEAPTDQVAAEVPAAPVQDAANGGTNADGTPVTTAAPTA